MNFYKRHLGDYAKATSHLSMLEHGAYTMLLDRYYTAEAPIPKADAYRITRARSKAEKDATDAVLGEFFTLSGGGYVNNRAEEELATWRAQAETNRRIAEQREAQKRAKKGTRQEHESCNEPSNDSTTNGQPSQNPESRKELFTPDRSSRAERSQGPEPTSERAQEPESPKPEPTTAGIACRLMRLAGCVQTNPSHPDLLAAIAEGVTPEALADTAREAVEKQAGKPFAWAIATARARHAQGARTPATTNHGTTSHGQPHLSLADRAAAAHAARGSEPEARASLTVIDGSASRIAR